MSVARSRDVTIERLDGAEREAAHDRVVVEEALELRARGRAVATIMRTPGADLELVRGLLHAESIDAAGPVAIAQAGDDAVDVDVDASAFAGRGLLATAACGVCGRVAIADLERRAREVAADATIARDVLARAAGARCARRRACSTTPAASTPPACSRSTATLVAAREDVGRHNAVDKLVGLGARRAASTRRATRCSSAAAPATSSCRRRSCSGVPIVGAVSAPSSLAIELAERFNVALAGFVRGARANLYAHAWRVT